MIAPRGSAQSVVAALTVSECTLSARGVLIPRAEPHLVARFGPTAAHGLDLHVIGARQRARRKNVLRGQRVVMARLRLGLHEAVLGLPSSAIVDRVVPLDELWGPAAARLAEQLAEAKDLSTAAALLESAIAARLADTAQRVHTNLALDACAQLATRRVGEVADALGVSTRNLRRVFRDVVGMSPKEYARLARFHHALREARRSGGELDWAGLAAAAGYYDQAHMIAEFRDIAGVTPRALLSELGFGGQPGARAALNW
ncbi:MAG: helix-turn-helix domain-containing protein [Myxococcaceae bacterium]